MVLRYARAKRARELRYKFVYSETTGYYENVPVLLRGTFFTYSVSANKNETFIII